MMKRFMGVLLVALLAFLMASPVSAEQFKRKFFSGSQVGAWDNQNDSISFTLTGTNRMHMRDPDATWDKLVGIFDVRNHVAVSSIDSLGKRDTVIVTLKAIGLGDIRIDTLQVDTLVVIRGKSELKYDLTNFIQTITTTHYSLDSGGVASDSGTTVNSISTVTVTNRFAFNLDFLTFDVHMIDSVMGSNDTLTYQIQWYMELIDEK